MNMETTTTSKTTRALKTTSSVKRTTTENDVNTKTERQLINNNTFSTVHDDKEQRHQHETSKIFKKKKTRALNLNKKPKKVAKTRIDCNIINNMDIKLFILYPEDRIKAFLRA